MIYFRVFFQLLWDKSRTGIQKFRLPYRILMCPLIGSKLFKVNISFFFNSFHTAVLRSLIIIY
jgi:hypothetical protein